MSMMFLLPSEPMNTKKVDQDFQKEYEALIKMDFKVYLFDHDQLVNYKQLISNIDFTESVAFLETTIVYCCIYPRSKNANTI